MIRIELEGMRTSMVAAFTHQMEDVDKMVSEAISKVCTPEHVQSIIESESEKTIEAAIREEVSSFFKYGNGRKAIAAAVAKKMGEEYP